MKAEVARSITGDGDSTAATTPDHASTPDAQEPANSSDVTPQSSAASVISSTGQGKQKAKETQIPEEPTTKSTDTNAGNLVGKINNLVTTDLANITNARDFLYLRRSTFNIFKQRGALISGTVVYVPLQVALCIAFLYAILGWR